MSENPVFKISDVRKRILLLTQQREKLLEEGRKLNQRFRLMFQKSALRFSRYTDASLVAFRWRSHGRGSKPVDLLGETGQEILMQQPLPIRRTWLEFERERQRLNLEYGLVEYERRKLEDWLHQNERLQQIEKSCL